MTKDDTRTTILNLFRQRESMKDLGEDDDFFDMGVSSLTIIDLQIAVEDALKVVLPTSTLMRMSTMREWIEAYSTQATQPLRDAS